MSTDGKHHLEPVELFGGKDQFDKTVKHDNTKNSYCVSKGIKLIRVREGDVFDEKIECIVSEEYTKSVVILEKYIETMSKIDNEQLAFHKSLGLAKTCVKCGVEHSYSEMTKKGVCKDCLFIKKCKKVGEQPGEVIEKSSEKEALINEVDELKNKLKEYEELIKKMKDNEAETLRSKVTGTPKSKPRQGLAKVKAFLSGVENIGDTEKSDLYSMYRKTSGEIKCTEDQFGAVYDELIRNK